MFVFTLQEAGASRYFDALSGVEPPSVIYEITQPPVARAVKGHS